jgi:hypothetical protein
LWQQVLRLAGERRQWGSGARQTYDREAYDRVETSIAAQVSIDT